MNNGMCLQCHDKNMESNVRSKIKALTTYSEGLATGYDVNQIRGIRMVQMDK